MTSQTCTACGAGYIWIQNWTGQIAIYPGTYAASSSSSWTECPASNSCNSSAATAWGLYTYSGPGSSVWDAMPTFLTVSATTSRSEVSVTTIPLGKKYASSNDVTPTNWGSAYCPGLDGGTYSVLEGLVISGSSITSKSAGNGWTGSK